MPPLRPKLALLLAWRRVRAAVSRVLARAGRPRRELAAHLKLAGVLLGVALVQCKVLARCCKKQCWPTVASCWLLRACALGSAQQLRAVPRACVQESWHSARQRPVQCRMLQNACRKQCWPGAALRRQPRACALAGTHPGRAIPPACARNDRRSAPWRPGQRAWAGRASGFATPLFWRESFFPVRHNNCVASKY